MSNNIPWDSSVPTDFDANAWTTVSLENIDHLQMVYYKNNKIVTPEIYAKYIAGEEELKLVGSPLVRVAGGEDNEFESGPFSLSDTINNILIFNANNELIATRFFNSPMQLESIRSLSVVVTCYDKTQSDDQDTIVLRLKSHIDDAYTNGILTEHPNIFDSGIASKDYIKPKHDEFIEENETLIQLVNSFENIEGKVQVQQGVPTLNCGKGKRYSYFLWYYFNKDAIRSKVRSLLSDESWNFKNDPYIGFNDRYGSFLYYYEFTNNKILIIYVGSNNYNFIDIYLLDNTQNLTHTDSLPNYRLKLNRFYDNLYFVLSNHNCYCIYPSKDERYNTSEDLIEHIESGDLKYKMLTHSNCTLMQMSSGNNTYMPEFSDLGDVLFRVSANNEIVFANIFGDEETEMKSSLLNTYMIDDRPNQHLLLKMYESSAVAMKYLLDHNFQICYIGSEYTIGKSTEYDNYMILFKIPKHCERRRITFSESSIKSFFGDYIIFKDLHLESIYGLTTRINSVFGLKSSDGFIDADRGVLVKWSNNYHGAFRVTKSEGV